MFNKCFVVGRVAKEVRTVVYGGDKEMFLFSVPCYDYSRDPDGKWITKATWFDVVVKNNYLAKYCKENVQSGDIVVVEGQMQQDSYIAKDGTTRQKMRLIVGIGGYVKKLVLGDDNVDYDDNSGGDNKKVSSDGEVLSDALPF